MLTLALISFLYQHISAAERGPISTCTFEGEHIADKGSCTRYYICRTDDFGHYVTDLLVCPDETVFDMVTSLCNDTTTSYWQDPTSCTTFYGCHATQQTSEGFIRQQYSCVGDLRFHPINRFCTFKTKVPDLLCNSRSEEQTIIGTDEIYLRKRSNIPNIGAQNRDRESSTSSSDGYIRGRPYRSSSRSGFRTEETDAVSSDTTVGELSHKFTTRSLDDVDDISALTQALREQLLRAPFVGQPPNNVVKHEQLQAEDREGKEETEK